MRVAAESAIIVRIRLNSPERVPEVTRYLLSIYQPDGRSPEPEVLDRITRALHKLNEQIKAAGSWVFTGGLHSPDTATVVRQHGADVLVTDGPYLESKEHIGGFWIVTGADLDAALAWATAATKATGLPIEVRPFHDAPEF
jgi:hypothetical protein